MQVDRPGHSRARSGERSNEGGEDKDPPAELQPDVRLTDITAHSPAGSPRLALYDRDGRAERGAAADGRAVGEAFLPGPMPHLRPESEANVATLATEKLRLASLSLHASCALCSTRPAR